MGTINPQIATLRILEAMRQPQIEQLMNVQPQPNPEVEIKKMELQLEAQRDAQLHQREMLKLQIEASRTESQNGKDLAKTIGDLAKAEQTKQQTQKMGHDVLMDLTDRVQEAQYIKLQREKMKNDAGRQKGVESK